MRFGFDFITVGIMLATIVHFGGRLDLPTYSLVGVLGIGCLAIALAGREALSNLIGTIVILLDRPLKIGDYVLIGDKVQGTVLHIGLRSTRIYTLNGLFVSLPNATVAMIEIINESVPSSETQSSIPVGVAYGSDVSDVEETLIAVGQRNEFVVLGRAPSVRFVAFGDLSLQFELLVWIVRPDI
jgi:small-conductance mechanosensitive channel